MLLFSVSLAYDLAHSFRLRYGIKSTVTAVSISVRKVDQEDRWSAKGALIVCSLRLGFETAKD